MRKETTTLIEVRTWRRSPLLKIHLGIAWNGRWTKSHKRCWISSVHTFCGKTSLCFTTSLVAHSSHSKLAKGSKFPSKKAPLPALKISKSTLKNFKNLLLYNNLKTTKLNDYHKIKRKENIINLRTSHIPLNFFLIDSYFYFEGTHFDFCLKNFSFYKFFKYLIKSSLLAYA